jgi:hypothetical protein
MAWLTAITLSSSPFLMLYCGRTTSTIIPGSMGMLTGLLIYVQSRGLELAGRYSGCLGSPLPVSPK